MLMSRIDRLTVSPDSETNEHMIYISFKYPIVGDQHHYVDPSKKSKGYEIIEGKSIHNLRGFFVSRHRGVKKRVMGMG